MNKQEYMRKYLELGFALVKLEPGAKDGGWDYVSNAHPDDVINQFVESVGEENIGLWMGVDLTTYDGRYVCALDFDDPDLYAWWREKNPDLARRCPTQRTAAGYHVLFTMPGRLNNGKSDRLSFIGHGWYILAPPSLHPSGRLYEWVVSPFDRPFPHIGKLDDLGLGEVIDEIAWDVDDYDDREEEEYAYFYDE